MQKLQGENDRLRRLAEESNFKLRELESQNQTLRKTNSSLMREASQLLSMEKKERSMVSKVRQIVAEQCQQDNQQFRNTSYRPMDSFETPVARSGRRNPTGHSHSLRGTRSMELARRDRRHGSSSKQLRAG